MLDASLAPPRASLAATLIGAIAILLWSALALLTAASGAGRRSSSPRSPSRSAAPSASLTPRRAGGSARFSSLGRCGWSASAGCSAITPSISQRCAGAARRSEPDRLSLAAADRALLGAAAGRAPALAPRRRRGARSCRRGLLFVGKAGGVLFAERRRSSAMRWRSPAPSSGRSIRCCRAGSRRRPRKPSRAFASRPRRSRRLPFRLRGDGRSRDAGPVARHSWARARPGRSRLLCLGFRRQERRHPLARRRCLRRAGALDDHSCRHGLRAGDAVAGDGLRDDRRRRFGRFVRAGAGEGARLKKKAGEGRPRSRATAARGQASVAVLGFKTCLPRYMPLFRSM